MAWKSILWAHPPMLSPSEAAFAPPTWFRIRPSTTISTPPFCFHHLLQPPRHLPSCPHQSTLCINSPSPLPFRSSPPDPLRIHVTPPNQDSQGLEKLPSSHSSAPTAVARTKNPSPSSALSSKIPISLLRTLLLLLLRSPFPLVFLPTRLTPLPSPANTPSSTLPLSPARSQNPAAGSM